MASIPSVPRPIQFTSLRKEDLTTDGGVASFNQQLSQIVTTLNSLVGAGGPTVLPAGIDVKGAPVTGLPAPTKASDAVSLDHASASYSPAAQQPQLDIGGKHALKGLTGLWLRSNQLAANGVVGTQSAGLAGSRSLFLTANPDTTPPTGGDVFQNTTGQSLLIAVSADGGGGGFHAVVYCDSSPSPVTQVAQFSRVNAGSSAPNFYPGSVTFLVPANFYYGISATSGGGAPTIRTWTEWTLGLSQAAI